MPHHTADNESNTEELAEGSRSILLNLASQLTKGMDLVIESFFLKKNIMKHDTKEKSW